MSSKREATKQPETNNTHVGIPALTAQYVTETFSYHRDSDNDSDNANASAEISMQVYSATTTIGGNIVSDRRDSTGIMIWPATHLICHHLASKNVGACVLELGCGCGMVGILSSKANTHRLWVSTDRDEQALDLCRRNYVLNEMDADADADSEQLLLARCLEWGNESHIHNLIDELAMRAPGHDRFDAVVGADIIYPATCGQILHALLGTVSSLLKHDGTFWLSFATRDGAKTPMQLIQAASKAGFSIDVLPPLESDQKSTLPPLLGSKILLLRRHPISSINQHAHICFSLSASVTHSHIAIQLQLQLLPSV
jgi:hypothetical protein